MSTLIFGAHQHYKRRQEKNNKKSNRNSISDRNSGDQDSSDEDESDISITVSEDRTYFDPPLEKYQISLNSNAMQLKSPILTIPSPL